MTRDATRPDAANNVRAAALAALWVIVAAGCTSPPSVSPLLRGVESTLSDAARHLEADQARIATHADQTRRMLTDAYTADLHQRDTLDAPWVEEATSAYVAAREAVLRHEWETRNAFDRRVANLRAAATAQRRALELIERQDALITQAVGVDLWQLLTPHPEPQR